MSHQYDHTCDCQGCLAEFEQITRGEGEPTQADDGGARERNKFNPIGRAEELVGEALDGGAREREPVIVQSEGSVSLGARKAVYDFADALGASDNLPADWLGLSELTRLFEFIGRLETLAPEVDSPEQGCVVCGHLRGATDCKTRDGKHRYADDWDESQADPPEPVAWQAKFLGGEWFNVRKYEVDHYWGHPDYEHRSLYTHPA